MTKTKAYMRKNQSRRPEHLCCLFVGILITATLICGCSHFERRFQVESRFKEANDFFNQGNYKASLSKYEQIIGKYPSAGDRVLFEMGIIYSYAQNDEKDDEKALESLQTIIRDYPASAYRKDSEMMIFQINNLTKKDSTIAAQQAHLETLRQTHLESLQEKDRTIFTQQEQLESFQKEVNRRTNEILSLQQTIEALEQKVFVFQKGPADKILIEKKERRLTLISRGKALKAYKIALGGNPNGPKERQGDNKTPEGTYFIDSRSKDSPYHISLHISYPNDKDRQRARKLGVYPGGDIMIHGIKNGLSWAGELHTQVDWTKGCIAVTDEEIEEIEKLAPNGTIVEIRP
jgi:murein L,D-transpeptidase YafK